MKFAFIPAEKAFYPVAVPCELLDVSRGGFYEWLEHEPSGHEREDERLKVHIAAAFAGDHGRYGSPRTVRELAAERFAVSRKRVARLMTEPGLISRRKGRFKATTDSNHALPAQRQLLLPVDDNYSCRSSAVPDGA